LQSAQNPKLTSGTHLNRLPHDVINYNNSLQEVTIFKPRHDLSSKQNHSFQSQIFNHKFKLQENIF